MTRGRPAAAGAPAAMRRTPARPPQSRPSPVPGGGRRLLPVFVAAAAAIWMTWALVTQYAHTYALAREAARLDRHRRELISENAALREEIHRLKTDNGYIEWLARKELGLVRPGEVEFMLVRPSGTQAGGASAPGMPAGGPPLPASGPAGGSRAGGGAEGVPGAIAAPAPDVAPPPRREGNWISRVVTQLASLLRGLHP